MSESSINVLYSRLPFYPQLLTFAKVTNTLGTIRIYFTLDLTRLRKKLYLVSDPALFSITCVHFSSDYHNFLVDT